MKQLSSLVRVSCPRNRIFLEWDTKCDRARAAIETMNSRDDYNIGDYKSGLIQHIEHPPILNRCIQLLSELEGQINQRGFDRENDSGILDQPYVEDEHPYQTVKSEYSVWLDTAESTVQKKVNSSRIFLDKRRRLIPTDPQELERLLRYAAAIDREIDRTLSNWGGCSECAWGIRFFQRSNSMFQPTQCRECEITKRTPLSC